MPPESTHAADDAAPAVRVTLDVIYETVLQIDKKVDPIPATLADHEARLRVVEVQAAPVSGHEGRIRALERQVWMWSGGAAIGGGALTALISRAVGG